MNEELKQIHAFLTEIKYKYLQEALRQMDSHNYGLAYQLIKDANDYILFRAMNKLNHLYKDE